MNSNINFNMPALTKYDPNEEEEKGPTEVKALNPGKRLGNGRIRYKLS